MTNIVHRTLIIKRRLDRLGLSSEEIEQIKQLINRYDALGNLYARGYIVEPPDMQKRIINEFKYFQDEIRFNQEGMTLPKKWFCHVHPIFNVKIRLNNERDRGEGIFIDIPKKELRLRGFFHRKSIIIKLNDSEIKYILDRLSEGTKPKMAITFIRKNYLHVHITFEREVEINDSACNILVIDVNSWKYGIVWALIKNGKIVSQGRERPDLGYINRLYDEVVRLEQLYGKLKRNGLGRSERGKAIRKRTKYLRSKLYKYLRDYVNKLTHKFIIKALRNKVRIIVDYVKEETRRELLEEKLPNGLAKIYLLYLPRFMHLLENQAKWYGIPFELKRLPSTICPYCGHELEHVGKRIMKCNNCGFIANRDEIPIHWILKQYDIFHR